MSGRTFFQNEMKDCHVASDSNTADRLLRRSWEAVGIIVPPKVICCMLHTPCSACRKVFTSFTSKK